MTKTGPLLQVEDVTIALRRDRRVHPIVTDVSFAVERGDTLGVVGESGSGKTLTMLAVIGLLPPELSVTAGSIRLAGAELVGAGAARLREVRGSQIGMVYQDPMTSLNPVMRVGDQVAESLVVHGIGRDEAWRRAVDLLADVGIARPDRAALAFPHEFSGGMRQRVVIASALVLSPQLLIADEPTTALDVTIQQQILNLVRRLQRDRDMAVLWVTHDLGVIARFVRRVIVMYAGKVVESADVHDLFEAAEHPYTDGLLGSLPVLDGDRVPLRQIPGRPPEAGNQITGCPFRPRCPYARAECEQPPPLAARGAGHRAACWFPRADWDR
ncbi:MAG: ABC transporter ATP-binding protein [Sporichthyaceae bacterium]|nr:ABC transporter ATP-binding protein [Sporichthyaceae bacterium]